MRLLFAFALAVVVVFAVPAYAKSKPKPSGPTYAYKCPNGHKFSVRFDKDYTLAYVDFGKTHYSLPAAMSASGSRYAKGKVEFWEHHGEAMLNGVRGGDNHDCRTKQR